jgi:hypothetical protein
MGLDLHPARRAVTDEEHDYWGDWVYEGDWYPQWPYGGFARFRERLAEFEGFSLSEMKGFGGERDWGDVATELKPLLNHSDCDGEMTPDECAQVVPRLDGIIATWSTYGDGDLEYDIRAGRQLIGAMQKVIADNLTLVFR